MSEPPIRPRTRLAPDVRRESILRAAQDVLLDKGLSSTTMADVADAARVAKGTVYLYFDSKEALLAALQGSFASELVAEAGDLLALGGSGSRLRRLDAFITGMSKAYVGRHDLYHVLFHAPGASEAAILDAFREILSRFVEDGVRAGEFTVPDLDTTVEFLLMGLHGGLGRTLHEADSARNTLTPLKDLARRTLGA